MSPVPFLLPEAGKSNAIPKAAVISCYDIGIESFGSHAASIVFPAGMMPEGRITYEFAEL